MATKVKPSRLQISWTPQAWQVPVYVDADNFAWWAWWGWGWDVKVFTLSSFQDFTTAEESRAEYQLWNPVIVMFWGNAYQYTTDSELFSDIPTVFSWTTISVRKLTYTMSGDNVTAITSDILTFTRPWIVDNLTTQNPDAALSANQWYILKTLVDNLTSRGRFLSLWNSATWLAFSTPQSLPYNYQVWDYFIVGTTSSATPAVNYKPNGSSYTWTASSVVETEDVEVWDTYAYDGTNWLFQSNHWKTVSFSSIVWDPYDNVNLSNALAAKQDELQSWVNIRTINWTSILWSGDIVTPTWPTYTAWTWINIDANNEISNTWVTSVNWDTWPVVLDADDISDSSTTNKFVTAAEKTTWNAKQDALVSWTNIKTINWSSVLGSWDLAIDWLPSQTGQAGKYLTTDWTTASWGTVQSWWITNDTTWTTTTVTKIWAWTETEYNALSTKDENTIYYTF